MNHASLGYIEHNGTICLPQDLLKPLAVGLNCTFFGVYYPKLNKAGYNDISVKYDFMLTPLPPTLWSQTVRMVLQLKQQPGSTKLIADWFNREKISIIHSESSRSGHRYATWSLHIVYEPLRQKKTKFSKLKVVKELKNKMLRECAEVLFEDNGTNFNNPIEAWPNLALNYFHEKNLEKSQQKGEKSHWLYKPFELKYIGNGLLKSDALISILKEEQKTDCVNLIPSLVFAELDTRAQNIRLAIISEEQKHSFFEIGIAYRRSGYPDSCIGFISSICNYFPSDYNIWRLNNFSKSSFNEIEEGRLIFLIEDKSIQRNNPGKVKSQAMRVLDELENFKSDNIILTKAKMAPLSAKKTTIRLEEQNSSIDKFDIDVFLSYSSKDQRYANMLLSEFEKNGIVCSEYRQLIPGESFPDFIKSQFIKSREVCILFSKNCSSSEWIQRELGASWILGKKVTPVLIGTANEKLPEILSTIKSVRFNEIKSYISAIKDRRDIDDFYSFYSEFLQ